MGWARWSRGQNLKWFTNASARYSSRTTVHGSRSMSVKVLYTTHAVATGGRNGHTRSADGIVDVDLSIPKAMGGPGRAGATTPEDLFAAGYAACFCSAVEFVARQTLVASLTATVGGLSQAEAEKLVAAAHQVCPYSNATRGNIDVGLEVKVV
jgi:organic hydroperoxide reductase OsmC/OhrA